MAAAPAIFKPAPGVPDGDETLIEDVLRRVERAKQDRSRHEPRLAECYKYALPWRHTFRAAQPVDQLDEIYDSTAMTTVEDFAADMLNTFTPMKADWVDMKPRLILPPIIQAQIAGPLKDYQAILFGEMARSNLYQALQEAYLDLAPGTMALLINDRDIAEPIHCEAIPSTELLIDRGPYRLIDGKWREWKVRGEEINVIWPDAKSTQDSGMKWTNGTEYDIIDGCYRDWSDRGTERYKYVVLCNNKIIYQEQYGGRGSCPMIVARWSRDPTTAWGVGPLYRELPDVKTVNFIKKIGFKNLAKVVDPVTSYEDDGVMNLDHGVNPGDWIPRAAGSEAPEVVEAKGKFDVAWLELDDVRSSIRRAHYQDRPEQKGKTPPSASQWMDEAAERARRMGSPATNLVIELQYPIVYRFAYLLERRGVLPPIKLNGQLYALEPVSPLLRAQEQEEMLRITRWAETITALFGPQMAAVLIDQPLFSEKLAKLAGVDPSLPRNQAQIAEAIKQFAQVIPQIAGAAGGQPPAAPPPTGVP
ncbi:MAG: portal protein [Sulfuricaulis sp.]|nr:portal protein [Sulfuricaulis sp.]